MTETQLTIAYGLLALITLGVANAAIIFVKKRKIDKKYYKESGCGGNCEQCRGDKCQYSNEDYD